jgi:hypothetical protein
MHGVSGISVPRPLSTHLPEVAFEDDKVPMYLINSLMHACNITLKGV